MRRYDLHSPLDPLRRPPRPAALVRAPRARGVDFLALTDHDEVSGLAEAQDAAAAAGIAFVCGTELSASWDDLTIHVVALRIDPADTTLEAGLESIREGRDIARAADRAMRWRRREFPARTKARSST